MYILLDRLFRLRFEERRWWTRGYSPVRGVLIWRCGGWFFYIAATSIILIFRVRLWCLGGAVGVMYHFLMIRVVFLFSTNHIMLDIMLVRLCETFKFFLRVVAIDCCRFEVLRWLRPGGDYFRWILRIYFRVAFVGHWTVDLLDLLCGLPFVLGRAYIFTAHRSKIIYKLFYTLYWNISAMLIYSTHLNQPRVLLHLPWTVAFLSLWLWHVIRFRNLFRLLFHL